MRKRLTGAGNHRLGGIQSNHVGPAFGYPGRQLTGSSAHIQDAFTGPRVQYPEEVCTKLKNKGVLLLVKISIPEVGGLHSERVGLT